MEDKFYKEIIEALLFVWEEPLSADKIAPIIEITAEEVEKLINEIAEELEENCSGINIRKFSKGYQMGTRPDLATYIEKLFSRETLGTLSTAALEALAIIAYKQPVTRAEIDAIRGVNSDGVIDTLMRRKLIIVSGKKDAPGKPLIYGTTPDFLNYFGLKNLAELPPLKKETN